VRPLTFTFIMYRCIIYPREAINPRRSLLLHTYIALLPRRKMGFFAESPPPEDSGIKSEPVGGGGGGPRHGIIFARANASKVLAGRTRSGSILAPGDTSFSHDKVIIIINGAPTAGSAVMIPLANYRFGNNCGPARA
jgi:hypothetical protein